MNINNKLIKLGKSRTQIINEWFDRYGITKINGSRYGLIFEWASWTQLKYSLIDTKRWRYAIPSLVIDTLTNRSFITYKHVALKGDMN